MPKSGIEPLSFDSQSKILTTKLFKQILIVIYIIHKNFNKFKNHDKNHPTNKQK